MKQFFRKLFYCKLKRKLYFLNNLPLNELFSLKKSLECIFLCTFVVWKHRHGQRAALVWVRRGTVSRHYGSYYFATVAPMPSRNLACRKKIHATRLFVMSLAKIE